MKIIVYTITECQFSKQEKEYLAAHSLAFEEKNLERTANF
jgi:glutaredoxin